jgi:hypothetical protein
MMRARFKLEPRFHFAPCLFPRADPISAAACAIFAKQNAKDGQHETHPHLTKSGKGDNYGIPDSSCRRINDGALRVDHSRLPETARMVTINRRRGVIK